MANIWTEDTTAKFQTEYNKAIADNNGEALTDSQLTVLGEKFGVTKHSVRHKASSLGIHVKRGDQPAAKSGKTTVNRDQLADQLGDLLGIDCASFAKCNKGELENAIAAVDSLQNVIQSYEEDNTPDIEQEDENPTCGM